MKKSKAMRMIFTYTGMILIVIASVIAAAYWKIAKDWQGGDIFDRYVTEQTIHQVVPIIIVLCGLLIGGIVILFGIVRTSGDRTKKKDCPNQPSESAN
jgi:hypothetical protein